MVGDIPVFAALPGKETHKYKIHVDIRSHTSVKMLEQGKVLRGLQLKVAQSFLYLINGNIISTLYIVVPTSWKYHVL